MKRPKTTQNVIIFTGIFVVINLLELTIMYVIFSANKGTFVESNAAIGLLTGAIIAIIFWLSTTYQTGENKKFLEKIEGIVTQQQTQLNEKEEKDKKQKDEELSDYVSGLLTQIESMKEKLKMGQALLMEVIKNDPNWNDDLKHFSTCKRILDNNYSLLWAKYTSKRQLLPNTIIDAFDMLNMFRNQLNDTYDDEMKKPYPQFNHMLFGTFSFELMSIIPPMFKDLGIKDSRVRTKIDKNSIEFAEEWRKYFK